MEAETLTKPSGSFSKSDARPGMAHFAGTGPQRTCRECQEWTGCGAESGYYAKKGKHGGIIKPRPCKKFSELTGSIGPAVPYDARACRYFSANASPPPITEKST